MHYIHVALFLIIIIIRIFLIVFVPEEFDKNYEKRFFKQYIPLFLFNAFLNIGLQSLLS